MSMTHRLPVLVLAALLAGCGASGGNSPSTSAPTAAPSQTLRANDSQQQSEAAAQAAQKSIDDRVRKVEDEARSKGDPRYVLAVIVGEYCRAQPTTGVDPWQRALEQLYERLWTAGNYWNYPLRDAAKQQGGCPSLIRPFEG